jgi:hypothetical protein
MRGRVVVKYLNTAILQQPHPLNPPFLARKGGRDERGGSAPSNFPYRKGLSPAYYSIQGSYTE